ncbi:hypothetical protein [Variovorax rhizosphaerae]|uniref:Uncharacterized protein n=1 Tax=Variovorax rhizosphaerae TaxID=1836200 RepID=A0ABU8WZ02_9BURK
MNFSTDEERKESLQLLREAADYLKRMPMVPVTHSFIARIEEHLAAPTAKLTLQRKRVLVGNDGFTPAGLPTASASLVGDQLTVHVHKAGLELAVSGPLHFKMMPDDTRPSGQGAEGLTEINESR